MRSICKYEMNRKVAFATCSVLFVCMGLFRHKITVLSPGIGSKVS